MSVFQGGLGWFGGGLGWFGVFQWTRIGVVSGVSSHSEHRYLKYF